MLFRSSRVFPKEKTRANKKRKGAVNPQISLREEVEQLSADLARSINALAKIGAPTIGASAHEIVLSGPGFRLLRYGSGPGRSSRPAVLIVYALVNRPWVLDLEPDRSMIARLIDLGLDVFLIEWKDPSVDDKDRGLSDYILGMMEACVDATRSARGESTINLLGVCQGGTFSLCYTALFPQKIKNLVTMVDRKSTRLNSSHSSVSRMPSSA